MQTVGEAPFFAFLPNQAVAAGRSRKLMQDRQLRALAWPLAGLMLGVLLLVPAVHSAFLFGKLHYAPTRTVTAQVIRASTHVPEEGSTAYCDLTCRYVPVPGGRPQTLTAEVSEYQYDSAPVGSTVTVRYNIADPSIAELTSSNDNIVWEAVLVGVPTFWIFCCLRWLRPFKRRCDETRAIERDGVVVPGLLIYSFDQDVLMDHARMHYEYSFSRDGKTQHQGLCSTDKRELAGRPIPKAGTPVLIYYLDSARHRML